MVEVRQGTICGLFAYPEMGALMAEYAEECGIDGMPPPTPHEQTYLRAERNGMQVLVALLDGVLIGFLNLMVAANPHYGGSKIGVAESFFVASAHRRTGAGRLLMQHAEMHASEQGAVGMFYPAPVGSKLARVLERDKSFTETNRVFFRSLA